MPLKSIKRKKYSHSIIANVPAIRIQWPRSGRMNLARPFKAGTRIEPIVIRRVATVELISYSMFVILDCMLLRQFKHSALMPDNLLFNRR